MIKIRGKQVEIGFFIPPLIPMGIGIIWLVYAWGRISDPQNYLSVNEMPCVQEYVWLKVLLGISLGSVAASFLTLFRWSSSPGQTWRSWRFWLWIMVLGLSGDIWGGLPGSQLELFPGETVAIVWAPLRIAFTASFLISLGLALAVILIKRGIDLYLALAMRQEKSTYPSDTADSTSPWNVIGWMLGVGINLLLSWWVSAYLFLTIAPPYWFRLVGISLGWLINIDGSVLTKHSHFKFMNTDLIKSFGQGMMIWYIISG